MIKSVKSIHVLKICLLFDSTPSDPQSELLQILFPFLLDFCCFGTVYFRIV